MRFLFLFLIFELFFFKGDDHNFASETGGAYIVSSSDGSLKVKEILNENKDSYLMIPKKKENKWIVVALSEEIKIKRFQIAFFEFFSCFVENFSVFGSTKYPSFCDSLSLCNSTDDNWKKIGSFTASNTRGFQTFDIPNSKQTMARYLRFDFESSYGHEYYLTLSAIRVFGSTVIQDVREIMTLEDKKNQILSSAEMLKKTEEEGKYGFLTKALMLDVLGQTKPLSVFKVSVLNLAEFDLQTNKFRPIDFDRLTDPNNNNNNNDDPHHNNNNNNNNRNDNSNNNNNNNKDHVNSNDHSYEQEPKTSPDRNEEAPTNLFEDYIEEHSEDKEFNILTKLLQRLETMGESIRDLETKHNDFIEEEEVLRKRIFGDIIEAIKKDLNETIDFALDEKREKVMKYYEKQERTIQTKLKNELINILFGEYQAFSILFVSVTLFNFIGLFSILYFMPWEKKKKKKRRKKKQEKNRKNREELFEDDEDEYRDLSEFSDHDLNESVDIIDH